MPRLTLPIKFGALIAGVGLAVLVMILTARATATTVERQVEIVASSGIQQIALVSGLAPTFRRIDFEFELAILTGDESMLEQTAEQHDLFLGDLEDLSRLIDDDELELPTRVRTSFRDYYDSAAQITQMLLAQELGEPTDQDDALIGELAGRLSRHREATASHIRALEEDRERVVSSQLRLASANAQFHSTRVMVIGLVTFGLSLLFLWRMGQGIVGPIRTLSRLTHRVARGEFDLLEKSLSETTHDEIGELTRDFVVMTRGLQSSTVSKEYVDGILSNMAEMLIVVDATGQIQRVNRATSELLEYDDEELLAQPLSAVLPEASDWTQADDTMALVTYCYTKSGFDLPVRLSAAPLFGRDQRRSGTVYVIRDVTKELEEEAELKHAVTRAGEATRAKSEFLANMSHEIRTPMNGIVGLANSLLDSKLEKEQRQDASMLLGCATSLVSLVNDILDFSKIEAGKLTIEKVPFDLKATVEETVAICRVKADEQGIQIGCCFPEDMETFYLGDPGRVRQIINNLVGNAIKFTSRGSAEVKIDRKDQLEGDPWVRIEVHDTGIGIRKEKLATIFEHFTQADASTTRNFGGTGLGLAITKQLVELMGGRIGVESEVDVGSRFWVELPLELSPVQSAAEATPSAPAFSGHGTKILLVEDNPVNQLIARKILTKLGCVVDAVGNGLEAVESVGLETYDAVLMDCQMPVMDGYDATREIRVNEGSKRHTPIIAMTANAMLGDREKCLDAGMDDYLTKPIDSDKLNAVLGHWLGFDRASKAS
ncbi:MAG: response regulator [Acidobacteria bacterium]|nr:MAG: response regulator [Acidobacteriota bacterium]